MEKKSSLGAKKSVLETYFFCEILLLLLFGVWWFKGENKKKVFLYFLFCSLADTTHARL